jgi:hypothetical protein
MFSGYNTRAVATALILLRFAVALEVFRGAEKVLSSRARNNSVCLATKLLRVKHGRNVYPVDLFGETSPDSYSCFFEHAKLHQESHFCSHSRFICPIKEEFIPISMAGFENASSQICHTLTALEGKHNNKDPPVNLIIVGGSVTWGGYAAGCMEGSCSKLNSNGFCATGLGGSCAWVTTMIEYLELRYKNPRFNVVNLAMGATSSCNLPSALIQKLQDRNITLSSRDFLLYDYSVNDGVYFSNPQRLQKLRRCMEITFENLVLYSRDGSPPSILLLESYPFKAFINVKSQSPEQGSYSSIYREVAKQYHLPVISFRDLFWHPLFRKHLKQYPKLEHIVEYKWARPESNVDIHPPWMVHDMNADVIMGALELIQQVCELNRTGEASLTSNISSDPWATNRRSRSSIGTVLLNVDAMTINSTYLTPKEIKLLPYGWKLYQDRLNKPGWIIEGNVTKKTPLSSRVLTFEVPYHANFSLASSNTSATLEIAYMETHRNAGAFRVKVCDIYVRTEPPDKKEFIDTLIWEPFSSLEVAVFKIGPKPMRVCKKKPVVTVKIIHENMYEKFPERLEMRGTQKVKISSVRITASKSVPTRKSPTLRAQLTEQPLLYVTVVFIVTLIVAWCGIRIWNNYFSYSSSGSLKGQ